MISDSGWSILKQIGLGSVLYSKRMTSDDLNSNPFEGVMNVISQVACDLLDKGTQGLLPRCLPIPL